MSKPDRKFYLLILTAIAAGYLWLGLSWYADNRPELKGAEYTVCVVKNVSSLPCPSCGSTRTVKNLLLGNISDALRINPLGILLALGLLIVPFLFLWDIISGTRHLRHAWDRFQKVFSHKWVLILFFVLITANWIWNINKGL